MKLSLSWIFQHLTHSIDDIDIPALINLINQKVVEIDQLHKISLDSSLFCLVQYTANGFMNGSTLISLKKRSDVQTECWYLIVKKDNQWEWATIKDVGGTKETVLSALTLIDNNPAKTFKNNVWQDSILEISSSAITHRPDLWGHRGFAREIGALLDISLKPLSSLCADVSLIQKIEEKKIESTNHFPFSVAIKTPACSRFTATFLPHIIQKPSIFSVATLLSRIDIRSINALVDGTNVVMMDLGHPMHAFDAKKIADQTIIIDQNDTRSLTLLDGQEIELQKNDIIIKDAQKPLSLAGIMGGQLCGVQATTDSVVLEAAVFDPSVIRTSATYHKKRTEASARFEKNLDPEMAVYAIKRYLAYAQEHQLIVDLPKSIIDMGKTTSTAPIVIEHKTIELLLGVSIDYRFVLKTLNALEFDVAFFNDQYTVQVPSFRAKDISIKEDIVEEIGRLYGYTHIQPQSPAIRKNAVVSHERSITHALSSLLSFGMHMHELKNYAFFDEFFLQSIGWHTEQTPEVRTPVSQNWKRLVNCLIPGLLKAVAENSVQREKTAFFEIGQVWNLHETTNVITESQHLGLAHAESAYDFYDGKNIIHGITQLYGITPVWVACVPGDCPFWLMPYQSAKLMVGDVLIGYAGLLHYEIRQPLGKYVPTTVFVAELNLDILAQCKKSKTNFQAISKFQPVIRDITLLIPKIHTADTFIKAIKDIHNMISAVSILDFLEKEEWSDHRSVTFGIVIESHEKTLTKEEIDQIVHNITQKVTTIGATVR